MSSESQCYTIFIINVLKCPGTRYRYFGTSIIRHKESSDSLVCSVLSIIDGSIVLSIPCPGKKIGSVQGIVDLAFGYWVLDSQPCSSLIS